MRLQVIEHVCLRRPAHAVGVLGHCRATHLGFGRVCLDDECPDQRGGDASAHTVAGSTNNAASCSIKTPRGAASSSWVGPAITATGALAQRSTKTVQLNATVPVGSLSTIRVPLVKAAGQTVATATIMESGKVVWQKGAYVSGAAGITSATSDEGPGLEGEGVIFSVVSGFYVFVAAGL